MYWEPLWFRSLTITLFVFSNQWQATISIVSNTTPSFSKINVFFESIVHNATQNTYYFYAFAARVLFHPVHVSLHFYYFLINIFMCYEGQRLFFCNSYFDLQNFIFLFKLIKFRVNNSLFFSKLPVIVYEFRLFINHIIL